MWHHQTAVITSELHITKYILMFRLLLPKYEGGQYICSRNDDIECVKWVTFSNVCLAMFHDRYVVISYQNWNKVINLHKPAPAPAVEKQEIWHCRAWVLWLLWTEIKQGERRQLLRRLYCRLPGSSVFSLSIHFVCLALLVTQCLLRSRDTARF